MRGCCCCCVDDPEPKYLFKGQKLYIKNEKVPEPEDLNWDSFEVGCCSQFCRVMVAIIVILVFLAISCSIIGVGSIYISSHADDCEGIDIPGSLEKAQEAETNDELTDEQHKCFCNTKFIDSFSDDDILDFCKNHINSIRAEQGIQYGITATSAIVNFIFGLIVDKIVNLTQPLSYSKGYKFKTFIFTIFMIFNTVFLPLLIYADIFGFKATNYVSFVTIISKDLSALLKV